VFLSSVAVWEAWTWPVPLFFPLPAARLMRTTADARHETICDVHEVMHTTITQQHGTAFHRLERLPFGLHPSLVQIFLGYPFIVLSVVLASVCFLLSLGFAYSGRTRPFFLCLHLWEVCMWAFKEDGYSLTATRRVHSVVLCLMSFRTAGISSLSMACHS
jgi:hypothetical protein